MKRLFIALSFLLVFGLSLKGEQLVDLNVKDADIRLTLEKIARQASINLIVSPKVTGKITCMVTQMDAKELILFIARANGFEVEDHGRILVVLAGDQTTFRNVRFEVISLQNASSAEVAKMIQTLKKDKNLNVIHDERTNRLILTYYD